jgi:serine/threonine-protein kinase
MTNESSRSSILRHGGNFRRAFSARDRILRISRLGAAPRFWQPACATFRAPKSRVAGLGRREHNADPSVIGTRVGNYRVESLIGEGGMGRVYLALHPGIGRRAAIKVLAPGEAEDPHVVSRFITEARAANAIRHPNIVDIYDSGVLKTGTPYIVMEYLDGDPLSRALLRGPASFEDAIDWTCQIAEALAAAHAHDVVHRDLKPDNLFLVTDPRRPGKKQVKVLDFGIAKLQRRTLGQVHKTRTGALLGTPLYMSPEQCKSTKEIDSRTDIYSLGVILYELVTGKRPFDGDGVYAVINLHVSEPPVPPSTYRPDLPPELEAIILQALAKAPDERQESMAVLLSRLELVRGDARASEDALARARSQSVTVVQHPALPPTLRETGTLGDAAVSKSATAPTANMHHRRRIWLSAATASGIVLVGFVLWRPLTRKPLPAPEKRAPYSESLAPQAALPPSPASTMPEAVDIGLASDPAGASVFVGDVLVGTTPGHFKAAAGADPVEFVFRLPGFEPQRIRALPAAGLTVNAKFPNPMPAKRASSTKRKTGDSRASTATDIQTER